MKEAWNRWGADDEIGAVNTIDAGVVRGATALVRQGKILTLAQPISPKMMSPGHRPGMMHFMDRDGGDYAAGGKRPGGFQFSEDTVVMPGHTGTHIDALCHCWYDDELYNGHSGDTIRSTHKARRCGIDKLPPIVTRGVLLDFVALNGGPLMPNAVIGQAFVEAACEHAGVTPQRGDAVLLRTGWLEAQADPVAVDYSREPGLDVDAALWLADHDIAVIGADNYAIEVLPFPEGTVFPVHQRLIRDYGIPLLEGMVLETLAEQVSEPFLFMAAALPIVGGTGSPLTPLAVL